MDEFKKNIRKLKCKSSHIRRKSSLGDPASVKPQIHCKKRGNPLFEKRPLLQSSISFRRPCIIRGIKRPPTTRLKKRYTFLWSQNNHTRDKAERPERYRAKSHVGDDILVVYRAGRRDISTRH